MRVLYDINDIKVNVFPKIIVLFTFISTTIFAHPHSSNDWWTHPHTHPQHEHDLIDNPDQFKELDLQSSNPLSDNSSTQNQAKKKLILFDDNFYLLDDDFDYGSDEIELQKMELNKDDLETAKEYENFLNAFFEESNYIGNKTSNFNSQTNGYSSRLNDKIKSLENENQTLNKKIDNLEKQLRANNKNSGKVNDFESERRLLNQKIENYKKQSQSNRNDKSTGKLKTELGTSTEIPAPSEQTDHYSRKNGFGVSAIMGGAIPILQEGFGVGPNVGIRLETPFSFKLIGMEARVGMDFYNSIILPKDSITVTDPISGQNEIIQSKELYSLMNIVGNIAISPSFIPSLEIRPGLGLTFTKIGLEQKTALSIPLNMIYFLPMNLAGFKFGMNLMSQVTFGHPLKDSTTSLINAGLVIKTPIYF